MPPMQVPSVSLSEARGPLRLRAQRGGRGARQGIPQGHTLGPMRRAVDAEVPLVGVVVVVVVGVVVVSVVVVMVRAGQAASATLPLGCTEALGVGVGWRRGGLCVAMAPAAAQRAVLVGVRAGARCGR